MGRQGTTRSDVPHEGLSRRLGAYASAHRIKRRWLAVLSVLAAVVVCATAYALTLPASTMTGAASLPAGAQVPESYTRQYSAQDNASGVAVTVHAAEGVVPEGAELKVSMLQQGDEAYVAAEQELAAQTRSADEGDYGFAAMDIRFEDTEGNEVEPTGDVYVVIDAESILPEDADPESVTVQHHAEKDEGVVVEAVADAVDATDGVVATEDAAVQAAFAVDGFSTFTITWESGNGYWDTTYFDITVHYVDEAGRDIEGPNKRDVELKNGTHINFDENYAGAIEGRTFLGAHYGKHDGGEITGLNASRKLSWGDYIYTVTFPRANSDWNITLEYDEGDWYPETQKADIYFVYSDIETPDPGPGPDDPGTVTQNATVTTGKQAVLNEDGTYDLTLSVTGDRGTRESKQKIDVLFILDESNSMRKQWGGSSNQETLIQSAKRAVGQIIGHGVNVGLSDNDALDVNYAMAGFYGGEGWGTWNDSRVIQKWTASESELYNAMPGAYSERSDGGTNYEAGFIEGGKLLDSARSDALKVTIFISDGVPGYYYTSEGYTAGSSNPSGNGNQTALNQAAAECGKLDTDYFYFVGITNSVTGTVFTTIVDAADVPASNKGSYSSASTDDLLSAFEDIEQQITFFAADHVVMTDPLSQWAEIVPMGQSGQVQFAVVLEQQGEDGGYHQVGSTQYVNSGQVATFQTNVEDADGQSHSTSFSMVPTWHQESETIAVTFTEGYELAPGYRYSVSTTIKPNQDAVSAGADAYDGVGDSGTGTHAEQGGFWSNDNQSAKVTFQTNGTPGEEAFPKPVIQVPEPTTGSLTISKVVAGVESDNLQGANFSFVVTAGDDVEGSLPEDFDEDGSMQVNVTANGTQTISGLPVGTYTVTEQTPVELEGYRHLSTTYQVGTDTSNQGPAHVTVSADGEAIVTVTNSYTKLDDIVIKKTDGGGAALTGAWFKLYYVDDEGRHYYVRSQDSLETTWTSDESSATKLESSGTDATLTFEDVPCDQEYHLVEVEAPDGYWMLDQEIHISWDDRGQLHATFADGSTSGVVVNDAGQIVITNYSGTVLPETGGPGTTFATIGGIALVAAAGCGYGLRRSRERRGDQS